MIGFFLVYIEIEGRHASAKVQEIIDHLTNFPLDREEISQPVIELTTSSLIFGYLSTVIW